MNILAVNWQDTENPHAGGAEIHLFEILRRLVKRGHSVTLLCSGFKGAPAQTSIAGVQVHRTGDRHTFPLYARRYFRRSLAHQKFDVIIDDINKIPLCTPLWGARTPVVALVPHLFGTTAFAELSAPMAAVVWLSERPVPLVYRKALFHAISRSTADDLVHRGVPNDRITVIYPGIDAAHFTPDTSLRTTVPTFLYLGRLKRYKGVDIIIRAFARVADSRAQLRIAGTGDHRDALEKLASSLGIQDRVHFLGFVSEAVKLTELRSAWATVFTSPKEGWGITNIESQACGTPVLASDSPGIRESVLDGESGILVAHGDTAALAAAMMRICNEPKLARSMGATGRDFAVTLSWERAAEQTESHLKEAIAQWA